MDKRIYLMREWNFCESFSEEMISQPMASENAVSVSLPHTSNKMPTYVAL